MLTPLAFGMPGPGEMLIIGAIALLLFGKRLPEVGKSLGKGIVEFKKGLKGLEDDIDTGVNNPPRQVNQPALSTGETHKFDPLTGKPIESAKFDPYTGKPIESAQTSSS